MAQTLSLVMSAGNTVVFQAMPQTSVFTPLAPCGVARLQVSGAFTGSMICEETLDNLSWFASPYIFADTAPTAGIPTIGLGTYTVKMPGSVALRLRCSVAGTGAAQALVQFVDGSHVSLNPFASTASSAPVVVPPVVVPAPTVTVSPTPPVVVPAPTVTVNPTMPDSRVTLLTTAAATPCLNLAGAYAAYLVGVVNNSLLAQTVTLVLYDSTGVASGPVAASIAALGPSQVITWPGNGRKLSNGCVALVSAAPGTPGIEVYTR